MQPDVATRPAPVSTAPAAHDPLDGLRRAFPDWEFSVDQARTSGGTHDRYVAQQAGHHAQTALKLAELFRRLESYEARQAGELIARPN